MPRSVAILLLILKNWSVHFNQNHFHIPPPLYKTHVLNNILDIKESIGKLSGGLKFSQVVICLIAEMLDGWH